MPRPRLAVCAPDAPHGVANLFTGWLRYHKMRGCWGIYLWQRATKKERIIAQLTLHRCDTGHGDTYAYPEGTTPEVKRKYRDFVERHGIVDFSAWRTWCLHGGARPVGKKKLKISKRLREMHATFCEEHGRCELLDWIKWKAGKGPYPLKYL